MTQPAAEIASETAPETASGAPVPAHVAVIMDGNGRWARARGLPRTAGHRQGAESARAVVKAAGRAGMRYLTLFSFSSENWRRPEDEISDLMGLLRAYLRAEVKTLHENGVRLRVIGERARLPDDIRAMIEQAEYDTAANTGLTLVLALSYGGRADLAHAARELARRARAGDINPEDISEDMFAAALSTAGIPDPDLLIRTSGEQRLSNFLLWEMAYTEYLFVDTLWPDFGAEAFHQALDAYAGRERRYGAS